MGVDFSGTYVASDNDPNTTPDLLSLGVLQTTAQDNVLRKLLGKDYDTMVKTANIQVNDDNLDGNGATVVSMFVRGLACNTKSVLMRRRDGTTIMTMTVRSTVELSNWIMSMGPWIEVLKPTSLSQRYRAAPRPGRTSLSCSLAFPPVLAAAVRSAHSVA